MTEAPVAVLRARAMRRLADFIEAHPDAGGIVNHPLGTLDVYIELFSFCGDLDDLRTEMRALGGEWTKSVDPFDFAMVRDLGQGAQVRLGASRESVCERVVVGTRTVMEPDPDAPMVEVEEEVVEWRCPDSLLKAAS